MESKLISRKSRIYPVIDDRMKAGQISILLLILALFIILSCSEAPKSQRKPLGLSIEYRVKVLEKEESYFQVKAKISGISGPHLLLAMTQNYGRLKKLEELIPEVSILAGIQQIPKINKIDEFLWDIELSGQNEIIIDYLVNSQYPYSSLNMVRLPYRDNDHLYFPAASVFIHPDAKYLIGKKTSIEKIKINFDLPKGWVTATSWGTNRLAFSLAPPSLDTLNGSLVGAGTYRTYSFTVEGLPVETAILNHGGDIQDEEINQTFEHALKSGYSIFKFYPLTKFFALIHFIFRQPGYLTGNALGWSISLNYSQIFDHFRWLEMKSHIFSEIFHLWNGGVLDRGQDDLSLIWFTEGVTDFYRLKNMLAAKLISEKEYLQMLSDSFATVYHSPLRDEGLNTISRSYYTDREAMALTYSKGCCLAFALDLLIRNVSSNQRSFDDVMKMMASRYDHRINGHIYTHQEIDITIKEALGEEYFPSYNRLYGKEFLPEFVSILEKAGLSIEKKKGRKLYFGIIDFGPPGRYLVAFKIDRESPACKAGLEKGDILLEINGCPVVDMPGIKKCLENMSENDSVDLIVQRQDKKIKIHTPWLSHQTELEIKRQDNKT